MFSRASPSDGEILLYVLNHAASPATVPLPAGVYTDLLTGQALSSETELEARGVLILARNSV